MTNHVYLDPTKPGDPTVEIAKITTDQFEYILDIQQNILNYIAQDRSEREILDELCNLSEGMMQEALASIMLVDPNKSVLNIISAPNIPEAARMALRDIEPGIGNGSCAAAVYQSKPAYVYDTSVDRRWKHSRDLASDFNICSCWSMPVFNRDGKVIGSFALSSFEHRSPSTFHDRLLKMCSSLVSILLERQALRKLSMTDKLTGLWNRVKLDKALIAQRASYTVYQEPYSVLIIDIDHFKRINDTYGHNVGDHVLVAMAEVLNGRVRPRDLVGRWGGEEFMVLLPNADHLESLEIAESIRMAVKNHNFGQAGELTVSIGLCEVTDHLRTLEVIDRADQALYQAKASGRDRVCAFYKSKQTRQPQPTNVVKFPQKPPKAVH